MRRQSGAGTLAALALTCVFGVTLLLSLAAGAGVYRRVADRVEESSQSRVSLSYVTARLHGCDERGMAEAGMYGDGGAVFLYEEVDGLTYETILYVYEGLGTGRKIRRARLPRSGTGGIGARPGPAAAGADRPGWNGPDRRCLYEE